MRHLMISASVVLMLSLAPGSTLATEEEPPATGAFSATGSLAAARFGHTATVLADGRVLVVGGLSSMSEGATPPEVWDPA